MSGSPGAVYVSSDIGGTFTDTVVADETGTVERYKAATTPDDLVRGVLDTFELAGKARGTDAQGLLPQVRLFSHGTTIATNALLQRRGARTGRHPHRRVRRHALHHARLQVLRARRGGAEELPPARQAAAAHRPHAHPRGPRARRLPGPRAHAARRGRRAPRGARAHRRGRRGDRDLAAVVLQAPRARAAREGDHRRGGARPLRHGLQRHPRAHERVRAHGDDLDQRLPRPAGQARDGQPRLDDARPGPLALAAAHAVQRRRRLGRAGRRAAR